MVRGPGRDDLISVILRGFLAGNTSSVTDHVPLVPTAREHMLDLRHVEAGALRKFEHGSEKVPYCFSRYPKDGGCLVTIMRDDFIHSFASCTVTQGQGKPMALLTWRQKTKCANFRAPLWIEINM